jgi:hypothetical protein
VDTITDGDLELFRVSHLPLMYSYASHPIGPTAQQTRVLELPLAFRHNWEGGLRMVQNNL